MASPLTTLPPTKRFLCVAPHPDDGELGMGGTLIKLARQGHHVVLCDLTNGEPTPNGSPEIRQREWTRATEVMNDGLDHPIIRVNLGLQNRFVTHDIESRHKLAAAFREHRPDVVFYPFYPDAHPDHIAAHKLAVDARFDAKLSKSGIPGDPHHPKRIIQYFCTHLKTHIVPTFCVDVSDTFERKLNACRCYESQGLNNDDGLLRYVETMHRYFGNRCGVDYAEPFYSDELIGLSGLTELV
jgi:bacillithiol biosynthesis deacetylase BshB1